MGGSDEGGGTHSQAVTGMVNGDMCQGLEYGQHDIGHKGWECITKPNVRFLGPSAPNNLLILHNNRQ